MKSDGFAKNAGIALIIAVVFYIAGFSWIEHRRHVKGPWEVVFQSDGQGVPSLLISQPVLRISQKLTFPEAKVERANLYHALRFTEARRDLPFGEMIFQDPTFLPGTVTMNLFGHEVELLPRVLILDGQEHLWGSAPEIAVRGPGRARPPRGNLKSLP